MHSIRQRIIQKREFDDGGFTVVEAAVAFLLITGVLLGAAYGVITSMAASALAKEHSVATGLANQAMAEAVAIPFGELENGLNPNETCGTPPSQCLASDPNVVDTAGVYTLRLNGAVVPTATSTIPTSNTVTYVPEISTVTEGITYTVYTYPTTSAAAAGIVTVIVIVTWTTPSGTTARVTAEDGIAQP